MWIATLLSQYNLVGCVYCICVILRSIRSCFNQVISQQVVAINLYSASTNECETIVCYMVFQEINDCPSNMHYRVINWLASVVPTSCPVGITIFMSLNGLVADMKFPWPDICLMFQGPICIEIGRSFFLTEPLYLLIWLLFGT